MLSFTRLHGYYVSQTHKQNAIIGRIKVIAVGRVSQDFEVEGGNEKVTRKCC